MCCSTLLPNPSPVTTTSVYCQLLLCVSGPEVEKARIRHPQWKDLIDLTHCFRLSIQPGLSMPLSHQGDCDLNPSWCEGGSVCKFPCVFVKSVKSLIALWSLCSTQLWAAAVYFFPHQMGSCKSAVTYLARAPLVCFPGGRVAIKTVFALKPGAYLSGLTGAWCKVFYINNIISILSVIAQFCQDQETVSCVSWHFSGFGIVIPVLGIISFIFLACKWHFQFYLA